MSSTRGATVAAWWPWLALPAVATGLVSAGLALSLTDPGGGWVTGQAWVNVPLGIGFSTVAAGIWSTRPETVGLRRLAVLYTVVGLGAACVLPSAGWARADVAGAALAAWVSSWVWSLGAPPLLGIGLLLFPDGHLPGRRWWPAATAGLTGMVTLTLSAALVPGRIGDHPAYVNPVGIGSRGLWEALSTGGSILLMLGAAAGVVALAVRLRRAPAGSDVRGQVGGFALVGALIVIVAALPESENPTITMASVAAVAALPITVGTAVIRHRLLDQDTDVAGLTRRVGDLHSSRRHIVTEREAERMRLRRDLHDGLGPSLAAIGLGLRQLEKHAGSDRDVVHDLADEVQRAVGEVRRICDGLRPSALNELGLAGALTESIEPLQRLGPQITLSIDDLPPLGPAVEVAAYRIVMEGVTNAVRHADAHNVHIQLSRDNGLAVDIVDDGRGLPEQAVRGIGLHAMAERADELGGRLSVTTTPSEGTAIHAWLPTEDHD